MKIALRVALLLTLGNLALLLAFPPFDHVSLERGGIPTFDGFHYAFGTHPNSIVNGNFLALEIIVVLVNACICLLLLRDPPTQPRRRLGGNRRQQAVLLLVAVNLVIVLLFPPFEYYAAISKAALPTFDGFYFLFGDHSLRQIVTPILYLEVALILINGGLFWLLFRDNRAKPATAEQIRQLAKTVRDAQEK